MTLKQVSNLIRIIFSSLLIFSAAVSHAQILTSREAVISVDKQAQNELLNKQLAQLDTLYGNTAALLKTLEIQTAKQKQNLAKIHSEIQALTLEMTKQNDELAGQIKTMYAMGNKERVKLLLNQQDPILTSRMMAYYDYLNARRVNQLTTTSETLRRLESLKKQNEIETAQLEQNLAQKRLEQNSVDAIKKQRAQLLRSATPDFLSNEQQINRLKDSETALKNLLSTLQTSSSDLTSEIEKARAVRKKRLEAEEEIALTSPQVFDDEPAIAAPRKAQNKPSQPLNSIDIFPSLDGDFAKLKGNLPFPVKGELMQKFGSAREDGKLDGIIIAANEGTDIQSITDGKVVYADWMRGYGLIIIVDHGKGYISLYAFNQSLYKKVGDVVNAGDVIASVGLSGGHDRASLYFGIRKKGKAIDPLEWCK
ncbi:MAG: peptidoglycan DD-metalloendopeptidase family protein [Methylococcales bacterium]|nr:peptidoglycan DD-metalloendopeptidase family protein [Methylococcales bacterium]